MKMVRLLIQLPAPLKAKLEALRSRGYTAAGYIRHLLEREFSKPRDGAERMVNDECTTGPPTVY